MPFVRSLTPNDFSHPPIHCCQSDDNIHKSMQTRFRSDALLRGNGQRTRATLFS